ncbi:unnamed protein product [Alternaria alternata]
MVGLPPLNPEQQKEKDKLYKELSYGGCAPEMSLFNANGDRVGYSRNWNCKHVIDQNSPTDVWADYFKKDDDGEKATHYEGFQVHLPDFKLDNSTFKGWQDDPSHMCDSLARFGSYDKLDTTMCPEIFSPAPPYGKSLPLDTISACTPAAKDSTTDPGICEDDRFTYQERYDIIRMYDQRCTTDDSWYQRCKESIGQMSKWPIETSLASRVAIVFVILAIVRCFQIEGPTHLSLIPGFHKRFSLP